LLKNIGVVIYLNKDSTRMTPAKIPKKIMEVKSITSGSKTKFSTVIIRIAFLLEGLNIKPGHPKGLKGR